MTVVITAEDGSTQLVPVVINIASMDLLNEIRDENSTTTTTIKKLKDLS